MIALLGTVLVVIVATGGTLFGEGYTSGLVLIAIGSIGLGTLIAALQGSRVESGLEVSDGLNVSQLMLYIQNSPTIKGDTKLYLGGNDGLHPAGGVFACLLDGGRALVLERKVQTVDDVNDLF